MLLVDERRLPFRDALAPAAFLTRLLGRRIVGEGERRAIVRRIAATRDDVRLPAHVRSSPSFAARVLDALDRDAVPAAFEPLAGHLRTLLAFADALDVRSALQRGLGGASFDVEDGLQIDSVLVASADDAFAWRRFAAAANAALEIVDLGAPAARPLDLAAVDGVRAILRYAASQRDADARRALLAPGNGLDPDDARTLLTVAGDRSGVLDIIGKGAVPAATQFAQALISVTTSYRAPDASAGTVLAAIGSAVTIEDEATRGALERIAADFDAARVFAPAWEAADLIGEIDAELDGVPRRSIAVDDRSPATPLGDEPAAPVAIRKLSFSASALNAYAECARKWWFRYACAAVEDRGSSASFYGIAFHAALEDFHGVHTRFDEVDSESLGAFLDACVVSAFDRHRSRFEAPVEFELQKRRARRTAKRYLAWLLERARRAPFEVVGCETAIDLTLEGHHFVGFVDRIDRDERSGTVTIVDYKTGSIATSAEEYLDDVRTFREFQLPFYYWARTEAGDVVTRLSLIPLKDALLEVAPVELEVVRTSRAPRSAGTRGEIAVAELERARERMIALASELSGGALERFPATDDPAACRYCAYAEACRERPLVLEERFAR